MAETTDTTSVSIDNFDVIISAMNANHNTMMSYLTTVLGNQTDAAKSGITLHAATVGGYLGTRASRNVVEMAKAKLASESPDVYGTDQDGNNLVFLQDFFISNPPGLIYGKPQYQYLAEIIEDEVDTSKMTTEERAAHAALLKNLRLKGTNFVTLAKKYKRAVPHITWTQYCSSLYNNYLLSEFYQGLDLDNNGLIYGVDFQFTPDSCPYGLESTNESLSVGLKISFATYTAGVKI